jgi:ribosome-associated translation inhibitor RaiA
MAVPVQITIRGVPEANAHQHAIRRHADRLARYYERIIACHVVVRPLAGRGHSRGYNVRVRLEVPRDGIVVTHESNQRLEVAIHDAFEATRRGLLHYVDLRKRPRGSPLTRRRVEGA